MSDFIDYIAGPSLNPTFELILHYVSSIFVNVGICILIVCLCVWAVKRVSKNKNKD